MTKRARSIAVGVAACVVAAAAATGLACSAAVQLPIEACSPGSCALPRGRSYLWQTGDDGEDVYIIDIRRRKLVRRLTIGPNPHGIAAPRDGRVVYLTVEANGAPAGELLAVDPQSLAVLFRLDVGREPHEIDVTPDGRFVYVPCRDASYWVVDTERRAVVKRIPTAGRPHNTSISADGRFAYLSPMDSSEATIVDIAAGHHPIGTIAFSSSLRPPALTADGRLLFQHVDGLNGFEVADTRAKRRLRRVEHSQDLGWFLLHDKLGWLSLDGLQRCHGLAITVDQTEVWSACGAGVTIHSARPPFQELARIPMRDHVYWLTFSPDGRHAFVAERDRAAVAMVETATRRVIAHLPTGPAPKRNLVVEVPP